MITWSEEEDKALVEHRKKGLIYSEIARLMIERFGRPFTIDSTKNRYERIMKSRRKQKQTEKELSVEEEIQQEINRYKGGIDILGDGSQKSDRLFLINREDLKDPVFMMKAHGYDPEKWEFGKTGGIKSKIWKVYSTKDGIQELHSSAITLFPKTDGFDFNKLIETIENREPAKRIEFKGETKTDKRYLEIPLFDLHMGNSTIEHYEQMMQDTLEIINKGYQEILFIVGQDLFHNDNFRGETANGTAIDKVDMIKAWDDAEILYFTLIDKAIEKAKKVTVVYNKGNHDESMSYGFVRNLKSYCRKNDVVFDIEFKERKAHMLGTNFIGTTHGDKNRGNLASNFSVEFPQLWSIATTREAHIGHLHHKRATKKPIELINDKNGLIVRELGTGNLIDGYHRDGGYTMAHSEFELFEYTESKKKTIYYV